MRSPRGSDVSTTLFDLAKLGRRLTSFMTQPPTMIFAGLPIFQFLFAEVAAVTAVRQVACCKLQQTPISLQTPNFFRLLPTNDPRKFRSCSSSAEIFFWSSPLSFASSPPAIYSARMAESPSRVSVSPAPNSTISDVASRPTCSAVHAAGASSVSSAQPGATSVCACVV